MIIDFHSHFLPGIDDGSKDTEMSLSMLSQMRASGVDVVIATSHFYASKESIEAFLVRRNKAFENLKTAAGVDFSRETEEYPQILLGAEVAFYYGMSATEDLEKLAFGKAGANEFTVATKSAAGSTLLIEMPFKPWGEFEYNTLSSLIYGRGFKVILAHYERYDYMQNKEIAAKILDLPLYVQINAETLLPRLGSRKYINMFKDGRAHLLGSDSHNLTSRKPNLMEGRQALLTKIGKERLDAIDLVGEELI